MVASHLHATGSRHTNWRLLHDYHCGGYAKAPPYLLAFMQALERNNQVVLEPVYSAKMLWGIEQLAEQNYFAPGTHIIAIHGGGIQGRRGFGALTDR